MTEAEREYLAKEAARLMADDTLNAAFAAVRAEALEALLAADADDIPNNMRLRAIANCVDEVRNWLEGHVTRSRPNGFDPNEPPE